jgi:hypothetical protein
MQFGDRAIEEAVLSTVDDPMVSDNPDIEYIHGDRVEDHNPEDQTPEAIEKYCETKYLVEDNELDKF